MNSTVDANGRCREDPGIELQATCFELCWHFDMNASPPKMMLQHTPVGIIMNTVPEGTRRSQPGIWQWGSVPDIGFIMLGLWSLLKPPMRCAQCETWLPKFCFSCAASAAAGPTAASPPTAIAAMIASCIVFASWLCSSVDLDSG